MLIKFLTGLVTRDVDVFVGFVEHLHDKLNALVIKHAADIGKVQAFIDEIEEEAEAEVLKIEEEAKKAIQEARDYALTEVIHARTEIASLKAKVERVKAAVTAVSSI